MRLSIVIPSIPERIESVKYLYDKLQGQIGDRDVEVLCFIDNKKRSIGEKRNNVKNLVNGKYFAFVDDDDDISDDYIDSLLEAIELEPDVITFKQQCKNTDGSTFIVTFGLGNKIEHKTISGRYVDCKRPPFQVCCWKTETARHFMFPKVNYGEDGEWVKLIMTLPHTEIFIDKILHYYNFDPNKTQASTQTNEVWKNPNGQ